MFFFLFYEPVIKTAGHYHVIVLFGRVFYTVFCNLSESVLANAASCKDAKEAIFFLTFEFGGKQGGACRDSNETTECVNNMTKTTLQYYSSFISIGVCRRISFAFYGYVCVLKNTHAWIQKKYKKKKTLYQRSQYKNTIYIYIYV